MIKRILFAVAALALASIASAQVFGPTTRTPQLTVSPGPTAVQDLTINGTCTGCSVADTNVYCNTGAACSAAGLPVGKTVYIYKPTDTSRSSTITLALDAHLFATGFPAGSYSVRANLKASESGAASGLRFRISGSGDSTDYVTAVGTCNTTTTLVVSAVGTGLCPGAGISGVIAVGVMNLATSTTISVMWAQHTSNALATILDSGSQLIVTRLQ